MPIDNKFLFLIAILNFNQYAMSNIRKCLLFVFIFCATFTARAQKLLHYDLADGLSSSEITSICENDYYMWIATEDGLNRFDGHRF